MTDSTRTTTIDKPQSTVSVYDKEGAEEFVRALFIHVLHRTTIGDEEVANWTQEILAGRGITDVLRRFAESDEARSFHAVRTRYPSGHFYSPVVDVDEIKPRLAAILNRSSPREVDLNADRQLDLLDSMASHILDMPFSDHKAPPLRYYFQNTSYDYGDACIYWSIIGHFRPSRIIEVGSGFTSALALDAIDHFALDTRCTFIDPYPELLHTTASPIGERHTVIPDLVQNVDPAIVEQLGENDILFIDSSHVLKTGSDVHFEIFEMLPRVRPGVIVHFHDTFYPFEYPAPWIVEDNYSWNELYVLHAFLMHNAAFEIIYFNDYVGRQHAGDIRLRLPAAVAARIELNPGGGLWLRRR